MKYYILLSTYFFLSLSLSSNLEYLMKLHLWFLFTTFNSEIKTNCKIIVKVCELYNNINE